MRKHRLRAALLFLLAAVFGLVAMMMTRHGDTADANHGTVVDVVVATGDIVKDTIFDADTAAGLLEMRRVPELFVPPGTLPDPYMAVGRRTAVAVPAGSYLTESMLRNRGGSAEPPRTDPVLSPPPGMRAVEVPAHASAAILEARRRPPVDVYVTGSPGDVGRKTRRLASRVEILAVAADVPAGGAEDDAAEGFDTGWAAVSGSARVTLAVTEPVARKLIDVEVAGGRITLLATGRGR